INSMIHPYSHPPHHSIVSSSSSILPLGTSAQGNSIGYDIVTVSTENNKGERLGRSVYYYKNKMELPPPIFLPNLQQRIFVENGQLLKEEHYNSLGHIVKAKEIAYKCDDVIHISGIQTHRPYNDWIMQDGTIFPSQYLPAFAAPYDIYSEWWYPTEVIE